MRFRVIDEERAHRTVSHLCRALGVTRAVHHAWERRPGRRADATPKSAPTGNARGLWGGCRCTAPQS